MKKKIALLLAMIFGISTLTACATSKPNDLMRGIKPENNSENDLTLTNVSEKTVTDFAVRLFKSSVENGKNILISPLSVLFALSMTANGADNETLIQMQNVIGMQVPELNAWIHRYMENLPSEEKSKLCFANSIWFKDTPFFVVDNDFLQTNADYYGADIYKSLFDNSTLQKINKWVEDNTDGMIKNILDEISEDAIMYLINAFTFDAEWQNIYKESQISDGEFITENGTVRDVKLMYSTENKYLCDDKAEGFIKYYKDRKYAFVALLPDKDITVSEYVTHLDGERLNEILSNAKQMQIDAAIPRFETEYKVEMKDILKKMGIIDAFDSFLADFSNLGSTTDGKNIYINRVIHQSYINVDGKGTQAGATTVVEMAKMTALKPEPIKQIILDRPFVYMLIDCENNLPLFIGTMMDVEG